MNDRPTTPKGLDKRGRRLWREVVSDFDLGSDELILLESACRTLDLVVKIDAALLNESLLVAGSMGQQRENPLLSESRQQRAVLARLLLQLKLPEPDLLKDARSNVRSVDARRAAQARWSRTA